MSFKKNFENIYNIIYSYTDSFVYNIKHDEIYEWIKQIREYFYLSESVNDHIRDYTNETVLGKAEDETTYLLIVDFIALTIKCYSCMNLTLDDVEKKEEDIERGI